MIGDSLQPVIKRVREGGEFRPDVTKSESKKDGGKYQVYQEQTESLRDNKRKRSVRFAGAAETSGKLAE